MIQNENEFKLNIITPEGRNFEKEVWFVRLPGVRGDIGVLKSHSPALIELVPGKILIKSSDTEPERFFVPGGTAQVLVDQVTILTEYFEKIADIDISAAEAEALHAERMLKEKDQIKESDRKMALRVLLRARAKIHNFNHHKASNY